MQLTKDMINDYLSSRSDLSKDSLKTYESRLNFLYERLNDAKEIDKGTLLELASNLIEEGYAPSMVNLLLSVADSMMVYLNKPEYASFKRYEIEDKDTLKLTRSEYQRLLLSAKRLNRQRDYLMIKTLVLLGLNTKELLTFSVEDVNKGQVLSETTYKKIPNSFRKELLDYIDRYKLTSTLFNITRASINNAIKVLANDARIDEDRCNPRTLRKLYKDSTSQYQVMIKDLIDEFINKQLENEQFITGW